jgi:E3 ubiquitin-protein ligase DOA10
LISMSLIVMRGADVLFKRSSMLNVTLFLMAIWAAVKILQVYNVAVDTKTRVVYLQKPIDNKFYPEPVGHYTKLIDLLMAAYHLISSVFVISTLLLLLGYRSEIHPAFWMNFARVIVIGIYIQMKYANIQSLLSQPKKNYAKGQDNEHIQPT